MPPSQASAQAIASATTLADQGQLNDALQILEQLVQDDAANAAAWGMLGRLALKAGDTDAALTFATQALGLEPENQAFRAELCVAQFRSNQPDEALINYLVLCRAGPAASGRIDQAVRMALSTHAAKGGIDDVVRPLSEVIGRAYPPTPMDNPALTSWLVSTEFLKEAAYFEKYPSHSLLAIHSRLFLYHCVRATKPQIVVEIGTYKAGTAEVIARALWENGGGTLYTTDPFGGDRCPAIIGSWPAELQAHIQFSDLGSMDFFLKIERLRRRIDIAFIDGNHDFEFAYFDLLMAARNIQRGGLVVLDNIEQQGPLFAVLEFLRNNPSWKVLGRNRMSIAALGNPMTALDRASIEHASIVILKAPDFHSVSAIAFSTGQVPLPWDDDIVRLQIATLATDAGMARGTLYWEVVYREFPLGRFPNEAKRGGAVDIVDGTPAQLNFAEAFTPDPEASTRTLEINLYFSAPAGAVYAFECIDIHASGGAMKKVFA